MQVSSWLLLSPLSSSRCCKVIYADVIVRCIRENENIDYTHNLVLKTECMSFRFVLERVAGWESLAQCML